MAENRQGKKGRKKKKKKPQDENIFHRATITRRNKHN